MEGDVAKAGWGLCIPAWKIGPCGISYLEEVSRGAGQGTGTCKPGMQSGLSC